MEEAELIRLMDDALGRLMEHLDSVQLIGSYVNEDGNTCRVTRGVGNWYSRQGMAREFLEMDAAQTTAYELVKAMKPNEGGWE